MAALIATGCEPCRHYNRLQVASYAGPDKAHKEARRPYGTVRPYNNAESVGKPFEVIGYLSCEGSAGEEAAILKAMLYRAADMGGDGVLLHPSQVGSEDVTKNQISVQLGVWGLVTGGNSRAYRAEVIRFK